MDSVSQTQSLHNSITRRRGAAAEWGGEACWNEDGKERIKRQCLEGDIPSNGTEILAKWQEDPHGIIETLGRRSSEVCFLILSSLPRLTSNQHAIQSRTDSHSKAKRTGPQRRGPFARGVHQFSQVVRCIHIPSVCKSRISFRYTL